MTPLTAADCEFILDNDHCQLVLEARPVATSSTSLGASAAPRHSLIRLLLDI
jgi:hypothetical protein